VPFWVVPVSFVAATLLTFGMNATERNKERAECVQMVRVADEDAKAARAQLEKVEKRAAGLEEHHETILRYLKWHAHESHGIDLSFDFERDGGGQ
jgi:hypothetical protein